MIGKGASLGEGYGQTGCGKPPVLRGIGKGTISIVPLSP